MQEISTYRYLDDTWTNVNFTVFRWYPVANITQWHLIQIYDYYEPMITTQRLYSVIGAYFSGKDSVCKCVFFY